MTQLRSILLDAACIAGPALCVESVSDSLTALPSELDGLFGWVMLECRVSHDPRVDVVAHLSVSRQLASSRSRFAGWPALERAVGTLSRRLTELGGITLLTVELDHVDGGWRPPIVFAALEPSVGQAPPLRGGPLAEAWLTAIGETRPAALTRVIDAIPEGGWVLHIASAAPRGVPGVRVVASIPTEAIGRFVEEAGWRGDAAAIDERARRFGASMSRMSVHLDVGDDVGPRVGIEVIHPGPPATDRRWAPTFEWLKSLHAEKAEALAKWPDREGNMPRLLGIKVTVEQDGTEAAKAYLACCRLKD